MDTWKFGIADFAAPFGREWLIFDQVVPQKLK